MDTDVKTVKIAGPAGAGIKSSGQILSEILIEHGFIVRDYTEYPSLIRGGHNTYQVSFSPQNFYTIHQTIDYFFSLQPKHWQEHESEFTRQTQVFGEDAYNVFPLTELSQPLGSKLYNNTICLGALAYFIGLNEEISKKLISVKFGNKTPNLQAFDIGYNYASEHFSALALHAFQNIGLQNKNQKLYEGNEAFGWGFIQAQGKMYAAYPMSPSSGALHFLAGKQEQFKIKVLHPEDEIAVASIAAGAAFTGCRVAVGTSGGGFALMTESVSLCGAASLGVVFYVVSRPGPATGLPTWTGQGDVLFAVNAGHGEFNKIVISPGDQQESFDLSVEALNLAAKFNIPVILLSDKFIAESSASLSDLSSINPSIITTTRVLPGTPGGEYMANSYEQGLDNFATEDALEVKKSVERRLLQLQEITKVVPPSVLYGPTNAPNLIVGFGSVKSTILEALRIIEDKEKFAFLQIKSLYPLHPDTQKIISTFKNIFVFENNSRAQLTHLLKSNFDFNPQNIFLKYDGRPFFPEEIIEKLKTLL